MTQWITIMIHSDEMQQSKSCCMYMSVSYVSAINIGQWGQKSERWDDGAEVGDVATAVVAAATNLRYDMEGGLPSTVTLVFGRNGKSGNCSGRMREVLYASDEEWWIERSGKMKQGHIVTEWNGNSCIYCRQNDSSIWCDANREGQVMKEWRRLKMEG